MPKKCNPSNPFCVDCHEQMRADAGGYFHCPTCDLYLPKNRRQSSGAPKKLLASTQAKRLRALRKNSYAWCAQCRKPMRKKGKDWHCLVCKTFVKINSRARRPAKEYKLKARVPWCVRCKKRMWSAGIRWQCRCGNQPRRHTLSRFAIAASTVRAKTRRKLIVGLGAEGLSVAQIVLKSRSSRKKVLEVLGAGYQSKPCGCGEAMGHLGNCSTREANRVRKIVSIHGGNTILLDEMRARISNALPISLEGEVREEVTAEMILAVMERLDEVVSNVGEFVRQYWRKWSTKYQVSIDADPRYYNDRLEG